MQTEPSRSTMHVDRLSSACANLSYLELLGQWGRSGWTDHVTDGGSIFIQVCLSGHEFKTVDGEVPL